MYLLGFSVHAAHFFKLHMSSYIGHMFLSLLVFCLLNVFPAGAVH